MYSYNSTNINYNYTYKSVDVREGYRLIYSYKSMNNNYNYTYKSTFLYFMLYKWKQKQINYTHQHHY